MINLSGIGIDFRPSEMLIQSNELIRRSINIFLYLEKEKKKKTKTKAFSMNILRNVDGRIFLRENAIAINVYLIRSVLMDDERVKHEVLKEKDE